MRDAVEAHMFEHDEHIEYREDEHDQVGTVEVQILLSWFFESSSPSDVAVDVRRAA